MDRATRKELKSDKFALEVQHGVEYVTGHREMLMRWGVVAAAALVIVLAVYLYLQHQKSVRQEALQGALRVESAQIGPASNEFALFFPTQADKDKAAEKAWKDLASKYSGTDVGVIANYYLAGHAADQGNTQEAEKRFKAVVDSGQGEYAAMAKLALAQLYASQGKLSESRNLLQSLMDHPTTTVSKETAQIALAHVLAPTDPQAARKLLEPLRSSDRSPISRAALTALSELPSK